MPDMSGHTAVHGAPTSFIRKYVFSLDHKIIGLQYYALALVAVVVGMVLSWIMRVHLVWPNAPIPGLGSLAKVGAPGGVVTPEYYLQLMTMHGTLMVFFVLTNAPFAAFGNYFLPIQIGAEDMAFPRFNMMSFWITFVAFCILISAFFVGDGPPLSGWTGYAPLSAVGRDAGPGQATGQSLWGISIFVFCIASLLGSLNFIATTLDLRTRGMTLSRMPIVTWAWFITSCIALLAFAVLMPACLLLILDRVAGTSFFIPAGLNVADHIQPHQGGSPLLWQHLFWFFGHPEVYIAILPAIGIVSHILICNMRKDMLSHRVLIYCMMAIGFLSYMVWGHHMFVSGMNPFSSLVFSIPNADDHDSRNHHDVDLAGQPVWIEPAHQQRIALLPGIYLDVRKRRGQRIFPGTAFHRYLSSRHLFCGGSLPHGDGRRGHHGNICRNLLLVPQDDRPHDE